MNRALIILLALVAVHATEIPPSTFKEIQSIRKHMLQIRFMLHGNSPTLETDLVLFELPITQSHVFTEDAIYIPSEKATGILVEVVGGGAGAGGCSPAPMGFQSISEAGASGVYRAKVIWRKDFPRGALHIHIGVGGAGDFENGHHGGSSYVYADEWTIPAPGGRGGYHGHFTKNEHIAPAFGYPHGSPAMVCEATLLSLNTWADGGVSASGGNSPFGPGGASVYHDSGQNGVGYGAGGGGCHSVGMTGRKGGDGRQGVVYVWEFD